MALIDPADKTPEQLGEETFAAMRRYREAQAKAELEQERDERRERDQP